MADTLRVNIEMTDDPTVVVCKMRFGNKWVRAKLRRPDGWCGADGSAALVDPVKLGKALDEAAARGLVADDSPMPQPGEIAKSLPRCWCNTVKVYEALWEVFGGDEFDVAKIFGEKSMSEVVKRTGGRVKPQTVARMLTALRRASAGSNPRGNRTLWILSKPTDELRERVEAQANLMNAHRPAAKEAARA